MNQLNRIQEDIVMIKRLLLSSDNAVIDGYINKKTVLKFFNYSESSLRRLEEEGLKYKLLKTRKIYKIKDIISLFK